MNVDYSEVTKLGGRAVSPEQVSVIEHVINERVTVASAGAGAGKLIRR